MPAARSCSNCGARLTTKARFCPECGHRADTSSGETVVQEVPPAETGQVPVTVTAVAPRFFGVTPPAAVLALAATSFVLAILLLVTGHGIIGGSLLAVAGILFAAFATFARRLPDTPTARVSRGALGALRARAGFAVEALTVHSSARVELFRLRRELVGLLAQRGDAAKALGEAVYADDPEASEAARERMAELDGLTAAKEEEMQETAVGAMERLQHAQLQFQPTQIETPEPPPVPEPMPEPSPLPQPVPIPEPMPEPSEPPGPVRVPEPGPEPSPPSTPQG